MSRVKIIDAEICAQNAPSHTLLEITRVTRKAKQWGCEEEQVCFKLGNDLYFFEASENGHFSWLEQKDYDDQIFVRPLAVGMKIEITL